MESEQSAGHLLGLKPWAEFYCPFRAEEITVPNNSYANLFSEFPAFCILFPPL